MAQRMSMTRACARPRFQQAHGLDHGQWHDHDGRKNRHGYKPKHAHAVARGHGDGHDYEHEHEREHGRFDRTENRHDHLHGHGREPAFPTRFFTQGRHSFVQNQPAARRSQHDFLCVNGGGIPGLHHGPRAVRGVVGVRAGITAPSWYDHDMHIESRRRMITIVTRVLTSRSTAAFNHDSTARSNKWMQRVMQMARRLEQALFRSANSLEEYEDTATLKQRLKGLGSAWGVRAHQPSASFGPPLSKARQLTYFCDKGSERATDA